MAKNTPASHATGQAKFIFRWKDNGICVIPSRSNSEEDCWDYAIHALRPYWMTSDAEAEELVRENGEVVLDEA